MRERIADAAIKAGRRPEDVTLVAVTQDQADRGGARGAGSRPDAYSARTACRRRRRSSPRCAPSTGFSLHIIGGLQTNKARDAVRLADVIETLDRPRLADAIAAAMAKEGRTPTLLIEVNTGDEPQKSGVARADADGFIDDCKARFGAALVGLMCVPPLDQDPRPHFDWLAERAARHGLGVLSMGMSADFEVGDRLRRDLGACRKRDLRASIIAAGHAGYRCAPLTLRTAPLS